MITTPESAGSGDSGSFAGSFRFSIEAQPEMRVNNKAGKISRTLIQVQMYCGTLARHQENYN